tara:strand:- start:2067 stop:2540 length:474 start_codon:yes stop_codon:yes gene_type:complete
MYKLKDKIKYDEKLAAKSKDLIEHLDYGDDLSLGELLRLLLRQPAFEARAAANVVKFESMLKKAKTEYKIFLHEELEQLTERTGYGKILEAAKQKGLTKTLTNFTNNIQKLEDYHRHAEMQWKVLESNTSILQSLRNILQGKDHPGLLTEKDKHNAA